MLSSGLPLDLASGTLLVRGPRPVGEVAGVRPTLAITHSAITTMVIVDLRICSCQVAANKLVRNVRPGGHIARICFGLAWHLLKQYATGLAFTRVQWNGYQRNHHMNTHHSY